MDPYNLLIIYELNGDFWHGNPAIFDSNDMNELAHKTFGELYAKTLKKKATLEAAGYTVISIWESDWEKLKKERGIK